MLVSKIKESDLTVDTVDRLLFKDIYDTKESVDCIIVLGSVKAAKYRVPAALEAYNSDRAGKIMMCGGVLRDFGEEKCTEAEHMRNTALRSGVPDESIILENTSSNTVENIRFALIELEKAFSTEKVSKVLLVTTAYHMRRSLAIARRFFPKHIDIIPCPVNDTNTRRDNWMNTQAGIERAKGEAMNIVNYVTNGVIPDFEL